MPKEVSGGERYPTEFLKAQRLLGNEASKVMVVTNKGRVLDIDEFGNFTEKGLRFLYRAARSSDIVHVHMLRHMAFDVASVLSLISRTPLVLTDHGGGQRICAGRLIGRHRRRLISGIAAVSKWSAFTDMREFQPLPTRILAGGGDHILRLPESNDVSSVDLLYVGRLLPHKGLHVLIDALPSGRNLRIIGRPDPEQPEYLAILKSKAATKRVEFLHDVQDEDLLSHYRSASLLVLPSVTRYEDRTFKRPELLGLVVLEALAAGTPAIGSNVAGLGDLLNDVGLPTVEQGNVQEWRKVIDRLFAEPEQLMRLKEIAQTASATYTWSTGAAACSDLYSELLRQTGGVKLSS